MEMEVKAKHVSSGYRLRKKAFESERGRPLDIIHWGGLARAAVESNCLLWVVRHWNEFPRGAVNAICLGVSRARLDGTLNNLSRGMCPCPWQGGWELNGL